MFNIILLLLTISLALSFRKILFKSLSDKNNDHKRLKQEYEELGRENAKLITDNFNLEQSAEETVALYDITKDVCKSLDPDAIFNIFRDHMNKYIGAGDCKFLNESADIAGFNDYIVLPLTIRKDKIGYLVAKDIREKDREKFYILAQQYILGIKRALLYKKVQELTITDNLTQVFNRRYFLLRFNEELERSVRFNYKFSFLMLDIDHFKDFNDRYGHLVGDVILREVAKTIKENMRQIDFIGRYGGEEFSLILTETDKSEAKLVAERFREAVEGKEIRAYDENLKITISVGISVFPDDSHNLQQLIDKADKALYKAKQAGRNRVCV
jgi:diguanylate cyclase (GGDEF)-like protein